MTSHNIEGHHLTLINEILSLTGIECIESPRESTGSEEELGEYEDLEGLEEIGAYEHVELSLVEEVVAEEENDDLSDGKGHVFPSASLRKILPDQIREFEKINRIHVLPEEFNATIDPALIPKIASTAPQRYIDILAELVGCTEYKSSLAEYWFLDTLANLLRRGQADGFDRANQAVLILWFCEFMKEIQHFDAADRVRMMRRFESNMLAAAQHIAIAESLPAPADIGVDYKPAPDEEVKPVELIQSKSIQSELRPLAVTFKSTSYECNLRNLTRIIHYIYDLFSTDYQYELVRSIFTNTPEYSLIYTPHEFHTPKSLYTMAKTKGKAKGKDAKKDKGKKDPKKKIPDPPEYIELMNLKKREEEEIQLLEEKEKEEWEQRTHILPLSMAVDNEFFNNYWPSAAPTIQEGKGKGGKKK